MHHQQSLNISRAMSNLLLGTLAGAINVCFVQPLWVANARLKLEGEKRRGRGPERVRAAEDNEWSERARGRRRGRGRAREERGERREERGERREERGERVVESEKARSGRVR